ncbi:nucleolin-like [Gossypium australe]|uniref:Nucleolin-like n=1 Tax=Gossypium australe TaxID=47621 RepID=A0A5B6V706_9ROSI|nr:nucleolin-like [Gossypium australe]
MENGIADLNLDDGEDEAFSLPGELEEQNAAYRFCLVGCFLTASVVHFPAMRNTLANIWHPLEGVQISDLGERRFLFKFFIEIDISRVITGAPWTFNNHLLIFSRIQENEDPMAIPLVYADWWVQIHDLPPGFFSDSMAVQFGNFIGNFLEHDSKQILNGFRSFMRIRVQIDVRKSLKHRKKVMISASKFSFINFKYEKLTLFCFLCGCLGHGESFCPMRLRIGPQEVEFGWNLTLRATTRRAYTSNSIWLREEGEESRFGKSQNGKQGSHNPSQKQGRNMMRNFNSFFGLNLEGSNSKVMEYENQENERGSLIRMDNVGHGNFQMGGATQNYYDFQNGMRRKVFLNGVEASNMECDLEDIPISSGDGNKRQRSNSLLSNVSNVQDSFEGCGGFSAHNQQISAAAIEHADRTQ